LVQGGSYIFMTRDIDHIAIVVDWLDACRKRDLAALLDLYADGASLECACGGKALAYGRAALEAYWRPRLASPVTTAFGLKEIAPSGDGIVLDYAGHEGEPVRMSFAFSPEGKIRRTSCWPTAAISGNDNAGSSKRSAG
jgi:hypothetical protein